MERSQRQTGRQTHQHWDVVNNRREMGKMVWNEDKDGPGRHRDRGIDPQRIGEKVLDKVQRQTKKTQRQI